MCELLLIQYRDASGKVVDNFQKKHQVDKVSFVFVVGPGPTDINLERAEKRRRISHIKDADGFLKDILSFPITIGDISDATGLESLTISGNNAVANVKGIEPRTGVSERIRMRFKKTKNGWLIDTTPWWFPNGD